MHRKILKEIESKEKYLDILVNNAGIAYGKTSTKVNSAEEFSKNMFGETSEKEWLDTYQTNVVGPFLMVCTKSFQLFSAASNISSGDCLPASSRQGY